MKKIEVNYVESTEKIEVRKLTRAEAGRLGGLKRVKKGFAANRDKAVEAGRRGGLAKQRNRTQQ